MTCTPIASILDTTDAIVASVRVKEEDGLHTLRRRVCHKVRAKHLVNPDEHAALVHPHSVLAFVDGHWIELWQLASRDLSVGLTFKNYNRREEVAGGRDGEGLCCPLCLT